MRRCAVFGCILAVSTLGLAQPVAAQNAGELSIGYSFLSNDDLAVNQAPLPFGFFFGTALELTGSVSLAFDLNAHFKRGIEPSSSLDRVVQALPTEDFQGLSFGNRSALWNVGTDFVLVRLHKEVACKTVALRWSLWVMTPEAVRPRSDRRVSDLRPGGR